MTCSEKYIKLVFNILMRQSNYLGLKFNFYDNSMWNYNSNKFYFTYDYAPLVDAGYPLYEGGFQNLSIRYPIMFELVISRSPQKLGCVAHDMQNLLFSLLCCIGESCS